jgi:hypothetical protein
MTDRPAILSYLTPPRGSFWTWVDNGRSIAWTAGETIAFRQEVLAVAQRLSGGGLPSFAAIVLLLAATRDGWPASSGRLITHARDLTLPGGGDPASATGVTLRAIGHRLERDTADLIASLNRVAELAEDLRHPLAAKASLAEIIFEIAPRPHSAEISADIVAELESAADPLTYDLGRPRGTALRELLDAMEALRPGLASADPERIALRLRTGLDQLVKPSPQEDLGPAERVRHLLTDLAEDPELGGLSRLARDLLAAVHVPRSLHRHEELPIGGVSDLSNRGPLDRLLVSELAHDDLTLAVRVAVNEALYMQRESPPREPPHRRVMLIDTGIRTWGVPRIYAAAVALAFAATGDACGELLSFRAEGESVVPVDLTKRDGLLSHLEALDTRPHFGGALPSFVAAAGEKTDQLSEFFLITQQDVLDDPDFRAALHKLNRFTGYAAAVARDGTFRLWSISPAGRALVRQATLSLDQLLQPPPKPSQRSTQPLIGAAAHLPTILSVEPFPLLLPTTSTPRRTIIDDAGQIVAITNDRRAMLWEDRGLGARELSVAMPHGRLDLLAFVDDQTVAALFTSSARGGKTRCELSLINLQLGAHRPRQLQGIDTPPIGATIRGGILYVICKNRAFAYGVTSGLTSGEPFGSIDTTSYFWLRGRIFTRGADVAVLAATGSQLTLEPVPRSPYARTVFEVSGMEGQLVVTQSGEIRQAGPSGELLRPGLDRHIIFVGVTADGHAVVVRCVQSKRLYYMNVAAETKWQPTNVSTNALLNGAARHFSGSMGHALRNHFYAIFVDAGGRLVLVPRNLGNAIELRLIGSELRLVDPGYNLHWPDKRIRPFVRAAGPRGVGYQLRVASWSENNRAFLDSRGLLHLQSADRNLPEITLVLNNDGPLAGWSSDGRLYGPKFFHGSDTTWDARHLDDLIRRFTERLP